MKFTEIDYGPHLPKHLAQKREQDAERRLDARQALWRAAINEACLGPNREKLARAMYHGEGVDFDLWPTLAPLTPVERGLLLLEVRKIFGLRPDGGKP